MRTIKGITALTLVAAFAAACTGGAAPPPRAAAGGAPASAARPRQRRPRRPRPRRQVVAACTPEHLQTLRPPASSRSGPTTRPIRRTSSRPTPNPDPWELGDPTNRPGLRGRVAWTIAHKLGFVGDNVQWVVAPFNNAIGPGAKDFDFYLTQVSYSAERAQAVDLSDGYYDVNQARRRGEGQPALEGHDDRGPQGLPVRRPGRHDQLRHDQHRHRPDQGGEGLRHERRRDRGAQERPDRRPRRRPADGVLRDGRAVHRRRDRRPVPGARGRRALQRRAGEGQLAHRVRQRRDRRPPGLRRARPHRPGVALGQGQRPGLPALTGDRRR